MGKSCEVVLDLISYSFWICMFSGLFPAVFTKMSLEKEKLGDRGKRRAN
jgi:hypothetical protein